jgi:hypothetical protein
VRLFIHLFSMILMERRHNSRLFRVFSFFGVTSHVGIIAAFIFSCFLEVVEVAVLMVVVEAAVLMVAAEEEAAVAVVAAVVVEIAVAAAPVVVVVDEVVEEGNQVVVVVEGDTKYRLKNWLASSALLLLLREDGKFQKKDTWGLSLLNFRERHNLSTIY